MKTLLFVLISTCLFASCNGEDETTSGPATTNVQNVNGNQPDTSTGITLDKSSTDTSSSR
jgi:hypothetical protein